MTVDDNIFVIKRNGQREPLDLSKFHLMVEAAVEGLTGVSASQIEVNTDIQFFDGITTRQIQDMLVKSAADLISETDPNYQYAAARLLLFGLRKGVYKQFEPIPLKCMIEGNVNLGFYDSEILTKYSDKEFTKLSGYMKHDRDMDFTYAGLRQVVDKYLVQDRITKEVFETPQYMYMMIACTLFSEYPKETRLVFVKRFYDAISTFKISLPTPIMSGVRTPLRQFASCTLIDVDDTLNSWYYSNVAVGKYIAARAGIGLNMGRIRGIGSKVRHGEVIHTGQIPILKMFEATTKSAVQNGVRGGSATVHYPIWHQEINDIIVLKNNKGTEDNRVRHLDYCVQLSRLFYERLQRGENITLFSTNNVPGLYEAFGTDAFDELYIKYENDNLIPKQQVSAVELFSAIMSERAGTGRLYIMNLDHANSHSSFRDKVSMSNLCQEVILPTSPINDVRDIVNNDLDYESEAEVALCVLSAINLGKVNDISEMENSCDLMVRALDALIDYQKYPIEAARISTINRRSLGIGYIGLAHYLAKHKFKYTDKEALPLIHQTTEAFQYYLLKASNQLAKEKGACDWFDRTKYAKGILPIDTYRRDIDEIVNPEYKMNWELLRKNIIEFGLRNSTLSAQMPAESSAVVSNATNGIEPIRSLLTIKKSKKGNLPMLVPGYHRLKNEYDLVWDDSNFNEGYLKIMATIQKFFDQSISYNTYYNPQHYQDNQVPMTILLRHLLLAYKFGIKNWYYHNTFDMKVDDTVSEEESCESCVL